LQTKWLWLKARDGKIAYLAFSRQV